MQPGRVRGLGPRGVCSLLEGGSGRGLKRALKRGLIFYIPGGLNLWSWVKPALTLWTCLCPWMKHRAVWESPGSASWAKEEQGESSSCCFSSCLEHKRNPKAGDCQGSFP